MGQRLLECQGDGQKQVIRICIFSFVVPRRSCLSWSHKTMLVFFLMLQGSLTVDNSHDVLTSTGVTEEAQSLAVDTPFRVLVSEGLPKVGTSSRVHEV